MGQSVVYCRTIKGLDPGRDNAYTGCRFVEPVDHRRGVGVATALLLRHGFSVVSQRDFYTLSVLGAKVDPAFAVDENLLDHYQHPWVVENLPLAVDSPGNERD